MIGKTHRFFAATLPGFEALCRRELSRAEIPVTAADTAFGGVEFAGRLHHAYLANLHLKTANRVLMRLFTFSAVHFNQLDKILTDLPWELFIRPDADTRLHVTAKSSRLIHSDAIGQRFKTAIARRLNGEVADKHHAPAGAVQQIFVRVQKDRFTVSLDTSGELLHKRGIKTQGGKAPVRETMAAAIMMIAGYQTGDILIDPMCGTGTFSLEAAMTAKNIPAGWYREFAFMNWPAFKSNQWHHIRKQAEKNMVEMKRPAIFASDIDTAAVQKLDKIVGTHDLSDAVQVTAADFFTLTAKKFQIITKSPAAKGLIVLNPPYGRRLSSQKDAEKTILHICKKLKHDFKGWKTALLLPDPCLLSKIPFTVTSRPLSHGGLAITLASGRIS